MGKFTIIPKDTFEAMQLDAGVLLNKFDPENPVAPNYEDVITATTGGITISATPTFSDLGEDVDNVPNNMMEFKHLDGWDMSVSTTGLGTSPKLIKMALGCADIDSDNPSKIIPRADLLQSDFASIWWVGDRADGGCVAVQIKNALATSGFTLTTSKNGKGNIDLAITGHVSINAQKEMPMEFYSIDPEDTPEPGPIGDIWTVTQNLTNVTSTFTAPNIAKNGTLTASLIADDGYEIDSVTVTMGGLDITSTAYNESEGTVTIETVTGNVVITATATTV
jgi:hypothetical protein